MSSATSAATARWSAWSCAVSVTVADPRHLDGATAIVRDLMERVDRAVSRFRGDSELSRVNEHAGVLVPVSALTLRLVDVALAAARRTRGAVDPTVGAALLGLGYDSDISLVRGREAARTDAPAPPVTWHSVVVDRTLGRVGLPAGVRLDLGATAKAWTADQAARRIATRYGGAVLVGLGGDLAAAGRPGREWRVDVAETEASTERVRIGLAHGGLATSSILGRAWTGADGEVRHHVVDPRTGGSAFDRWRTATVWAPTALAANVASTWALVEGDAADRHLQAQRLPARLVDHDGDIELRGSWPDESVAVA